MPNFFSFLVFPTKAVMYAGSRASLWIFVCYGRVRGESVMAPGGGEERDPAKGKRTVEVKPDSWLGFGVALIDTHERGSFGSAFGAGQDHAPGT